MDRLEAMSILLAVVDAGSLSGAARRLGTSPASVTRAVAQLEADSGVRLLERTTRRLSLTDAGERHVATYRVVLDELGRLDGQASSEDMAGTVVVTAPELFGRMRVMPIVNAFLAAHPRVRMRVLLLNRMVDLVSEGVDVAIRLAELQDSSMRAIRVGEVRRLTCAAPSYLSRNPAPRHPAGLSDHVCIGLNEAGSQELWPYREARSSRLRSVRVSCRLSLNGAAAAIDAAEKGLGIVRPLSYQVESQLAAGLLVPVLTDYEPAAIPVHLVFRNQPGDGGAARAFIDHAAPLLRSGFAAASAA